MDKIKYVQARAGDVASGIDAIINSLEGEDEQTIILSCIGLAVLMNDPNIDPKRFLDIVKDTTEFIALAVADTGKFQ